MAPSSRLALPRCSESVRTAGARHLQTPLHPPLAVRSAPPTLERTRRGSRPSTAGTPASRGYLRQFESPPSVAGLALPEPAGHKGSRRATGRSKLSRSPLYNGIFPFTTASSRRFNIEPPKLAYREHWDTESPMLRMPGSRWKTVGVDGPRWPVGEIRASRKLDRGGPVRPASFRESHSMPT